MMPRRSSSTSARSPTCDPSKLPKRNRLPRPMPGFWPGNARTIKLMNNLLAAQTGRPLLAYDMSSDGQNSYSGTAGAALAKQDYKPLETIIRQALETAKSDQSP